jgi:hypothetical protein
MVLIFAIPAQSQLINSQENILLQYVEIKRKTGYIHIHLKFSGQSPEFLKVYQRNVEADEQAWVEWVLELHKVTTDSLLLKTELPEWLELRNIHSQNGNSYSVLKINLKSESAHRIRRDNQSLSLIVKDNTYTPPGFFDRWGMVLGVLVLSGFLGLAMYL